jgi:hypothetical protein
LRGWEEISEIPYLIFVEALPLNYWQFSQWVIPHLLPMAYLRHNRVSRKIRGTFGPEFDLHELYAGPPWKPGGKESEPSAWYDGFIVKKSFGSSGSSKAGAGTPSRPFSASLPWTIFIGSTPDVSPPSREPSNGVWSSWIHFISTTAKGTTSAA